MEHAKKSLESLLEALSGIKDQKELSAWVSIVSVTLEANNLQYELELWDKGSTSASYLSSFESQKKSVEGVLRGICANLR